MKKVHVPISQKKVICKWLLQKEQMSKYIIISHLHVYIIL